MKGGFTSNPPSHRQPTKETNLAGLDQLQISEDLSQLSDVPAAYRRMSDRRRLGIKNEAQGYGMIPLTQGKFAYVNFAERMELKRWIRKIVGSERMNG